MWRSGFLGPPDNPTGSITPALPDNFERHVSLRKYLLNEWTGLQQGSCFKVKKNTRAENQAHKFVKTERLRIGDGWRWQHHAKALRQSGHEEVPGWDLRPCWGSWGPLVVGLARKLLALGTNQGIQLGTYVTTMLNDPIHKQQRNARVQQMITKLRVSSSSGVSSKEVASAGMVLLFWLGVVASSVAASAQVDQRVGVLLQRLYVNLHSRGAKKWVAAVGLV